MTKVALFGIHFQGRGHYWETSDKISIDELGWRVLMYYFWLLRNPDKLETLKELTKYQNIIIYGLEDMHFGYGIEKDELQEYTNPYQEPKPITSILYEKDVEQVVGMDEEYGASYIYTIYLDTNKLECRQLEKETIHIDSESFEGVEWLHTHKFINPHICKEFELNQNNIDDLTRAILLAVYEFRYIRPIADWFIANPSTTSEMIMRYSNLARAVGKHLLVSEEVSEYLIKQFSVKKNMNVKLKTLEERINNIEAYLMSSKW